MNHMIILASAWIATALGLWGGGNPMVDYCLAIGASYALAAHFLAEKINPPEKS